MENQKIDVIKPAARSGLMLGLISIIVALVIYLLNGALFANFWVGIGILLLSLALVVVFGISFRNTIGGFISFKHAFLYSLVLLLVAGLVGQVFNYLLFNVIDPELTGVVTDAALENTESIMEKFNAPPDEIDKALDRTEKQMENQYSLAGIAKGYLIAIVIYGIISLITGAIIKKRNPEEAI